jgi:homocitrate synthase
LVTGVDGINMYMATSEILAKHSHKKGIDEIKRIACKMVEYIKSKNVEVRFSCEDSFRSNVTDMLDIYKSVIDAGADRIGIADTVGISDSFTVMKLLSHVRKQLPKTSIEFHCHNDTGSANENAFTALRFGATHIDTTVLGIGERNGITQLGALIAKICANEESLKIAKSKYNLSQLIKIEKYISMICNTPIPHNNPISGTAFVHKAGVHSNAAISNPKSYEILDPSLFDIDRNICVASKLTGKNAIKKRALDLNLDLSDEKINELTKIIKNIFDNEEPNIEIVDKLLYQHRTKKQINFTMITEKEKLSFKLIGHLFDREIVNTIADICTSKNVLKYEINTTPALKNDDKSMAHVKIEMKSQEEINDIKTTINKYINGINYDKNICEIEYE